MIISAAGRRSVDFEHEQRLAEAADPGAAGAGC